jgi:BolA protein
MSRADAIRSRLETELAPSVLDVINESHQHSVPQGSETHFKVVVVSAAFDGLPQLARHRRVYALLEGELKDGLHALTVTARTPTEWSAPGGSVPLTSPACMGGSKRG